MNVYANMQICMMVVPVVVTILEFGIGFLRTFAWLVLLSNGRHSSTQCCTSRHATNLLDSFLHDKHAARRNGISRWNTWFAETSVDLLLVDKHLGCPREPLFQSAPLHLGDLVVPVYQALSFSMESTLVVRLTVQRIWHATCSDRFLKSIVISRLAAHHQMQWCTCI